MVDVEAPRQVGTPPEEVKTVIEKTIGYILKNGQAFEDKLKKEEDTKDKFHFLQEDDKYHRYYKWRIEQEQRGTHTSSLHNGKETESKNLGEEIKKDEVEHMTLPFLIKVPPISSLDLNVIKLTALFVARNGRLYIEKLYKHENARHLKAQFEFLSDKHSLHSLFMKYVEQYRTLLELLFDEKVRSKEGNDIRERIHRPDALLNRSMMRAEYEKQHKRTKLNEKKDKEERNQHYASIDWQDFAFAAVIDFDAVDEVRELPPPITRTSLIHRSLETKHSGKELEHIIETHPAERKQNESEIEGLQFKAPKGMKIKAAGESRLKNRTSSVNAGTQRTIRCPLTGDLIPEQKFDEHLKVLLRDPRYKEEQENYLKKNFKYASNLTSEQVYDNIKRLAKKRGTIVATESKEKRLPQIGPRE